MSLPVWTGHLREMYSEFWFLILLLSDAFKWSACNPPSSFHSTLFSLSTAPTLQTPHPSDLLFLPCFLPPSHDPTLAVVILSLSHPVPLVDWQRDFASSSPRHCHAWRCSGCSRKADTANLCGCLLLAKITLGSGKYRGKKNDDFQHLCYLSKFEFIKSTSERHDTGPGAIPTYARFQRQTMEVLTLFKNWLKES